MTPYWLLICYPILASLAPIRTNYSLNLLNLTIFAILAILIIGLRFEVGGDWFSYLIYLENARYMSFDRILISSDPGYVLINWISSSLGLGIAGVNLFGGSVFIYGLLRFCIRQPLPWLGLLVATPYLLIVVGMGYSRQSIAIGFALIALSIWNEKNIIKFFVLISLAALFHKSAAILFPLAFFIKTKRNEIKWVFAAPGIIVVSLLLFFNFFQSDLFKAMFLNSSFSSGGVWFRLALNLVPSIILLFLYKRFSNFDDNKLWILIAFGSFFTVFTAFNFSTVTDRFSLYLSPIQIAIYSRLPSLIKDLYLRSVVIILVVFMYSMVLFVFLNLGTNAKSWIPYKMVF